MVKFSNSVPKVFTASPIDVVLLKCRKIFPTENRRNRALFTGQKKFQLPLKLSLVRGSLPKSTIWLTLFQNFPCPALDL